MISMLEYLSPLAGSHARDQLRSIVQTQLSMTPSESPRDALHHDFRAFIYKNCHPFKISG